MITNASATLYHRTSTGWTRTSIGECWWYETDKGNTSTDGLKDNHVVKIRIPDTTVVIAKKDYIIKGDVVVSMDTIKDLSSYDYHSVKEVTYNTHGWNQHIKVVC